MAKNPTKDAHVHVRTALKIGSLLAVAISLAGFGIVKWHQRLERRAKRAAQAIEQSIANAAQIAALAKDSQARADRRQREQRRREALTAYENVIKPLFAEKCYGCHGATKQASGVRLDTVFAMNRGGDNGPFLNPDLAGESQLLAVLQGEDGFSRMPKDGSPLTSEQIGTVKNWLEAGSPAPSAEVGMDPADKHWAFRPLQSAAVPAPTAKWVRGPIDAFLAQSMGEKGSLPAPQAEKSILLRRVYLDLIGLPPTLEDLNQFLADPTPDAYEKVVGRLLDSKRYGERWGRHWMDVWRYSEPDGRKSEKQVWWSDPLIWRWRDWIVESLNRDKGYDRMLLEMLAGDELPDKSVETLIATGFLVRNRFWSDRNVWLNNTVEHTAKAFLGLTLNCARCHDHKFDPITQKEYYQFRHFFEAHEIRTQEFSVEQERQNRPPPERRSNSRRFSSSAHLTRGQAIRRIFCGSLGKS